MSIPRILHVKQKLRLMVKSTETERIVFELIANRIDIVLEREHYTDKDMLADVDDFISTRDALFIADRHTLEERDVDVALTKVWDLLYEDNKDIQDVLYPDNSVSVTDYVEPDAQDTYDEANLHAAEAELGTHLHHCNKGEYDDTCKYGEDDTCPAIHGTTAAPIAAPFDPTKPVQTRDGRAARIVCTDRKFKNTGGDTLPLMGLIDQGTHEFLAYYHLTGEGVAGVEQDSDLINVPEEPVKHEGFIRVYKDFSGGGYHIGDVYSTKEETDCVPFKKSIACIPITFTEGEGL